jgi:hypothetical protein
MAIQLQIIHNALLRTETPGVPRSYDDFLDLVDDAIEEPGGTADDLDPTPRQVSAT